ncbi:hypothetical protein HH308_11600 [Gordonia sp. TBRC 11910]|uniref:ApeA N-terminal domain-containing protein n=1 Tax=Gordonia asplenii TaxID=2725283 RepID=A0A848KT39_9ACTN|nr:hypothetical protein [Gordonia asplenii]NMO01856.1 hypothetical protein [Gordonia asplenii]
MTKIAGYYELESSFVTNAAIADLTLETLIEGHAVTIELPRLSATNPWELAPARSVPWTNGDWGMVTSLEGGRAASIVVQSIGFTFEVASDDPTERAREIVLQLDAWWAKTSSWLEIATGQILSKIGHTTVETIGEKTPVWSVNDDEDGHKPLTWPSVTTIDMGNRVRAVDKDNLAAALALVAIDKSPPLAWTLVRDARSLADAGQLRRAIVDLGSAAEIGVRTLLHHQLDLTVPTGIKERLTKRPPTLGQAAQILEQAGFGSLPASFRSDVVEIRNRVVHLAAASSTDDVSYEEYECALKSAVAVVELASPLPDGIVREWYERED